IETYLYFASVPFDLEVEITENPFRCELCQHNTNASVVFSVTVKFNSRTKESRTQFENFSLEYLLARDFKLTLSETFQVLLKPRVQFIKSKMHQTNGSLKREYFTSTLHFLKTFIKLSSLTLCKYVSFNETDYQITVNDTVTPPDVSISIDFNVTKIIIKNNKDLIMAEVTDEGRLNVCVDLLDRFVKESKEKSKRREKWCVEIACLVEYILTLTCFSLSAVCLLLTILTYLMLPELRTMAGLNNFFLSCSLLLAQLSSLASISIFQQGIHCKVLGVVTHFLWLWNFSWSFICSYHMLRVFTDQTRSRALRTTIGLMWKYMCGSFTMPVFVVMTCIGYNYFIIEQRNIGYGKTRCYLDSSLSVGVTVAAPVLIITAVNVTFFLKVVYTIYKVRTLQSMEAAGSDFDFKIYMKLSTVTGIFWIVAFLAESMASDILKLMSVVLNGLQGVAIFYSFVCNKRVLMYWKTVYEHRCTD
ncbi:adhesion G-protein coupled receptor D1, partial [Biomphalaria glabrata]